MSDSSSVSSSTAATNGTGTPGSPLVRFDQVTKTYTRGQTPVHALDDVNLEIPEGQFVGVVGPSGSGKSTLLNLIGALDTPTEGRVVVAGQDVGTATEAERARLRGGEVGFVFQTFNLMPRLTAVDTVALPPVFAGVPRDERTTRAR